jgi:predicted ATP-grasp superfamily ATP-dependent carboligase
MKVFVYEYCCCQPLSGGAAVKALRTEGMAMLSALMLDLMRVAGAEPIALLADSQQVVPFPCRRVMPSTEKRAFRKLAAESDWTIVIAPETDGILEERCRWVERAGGKLLGPSLEAIRLTADKLALAQHLQKHGVPTPAARHVAQLGAEIDPAFLPGVCKPRFGAGSLSTYLVHSAADLGRISESESSADFILQPFVRGIPASLAMLIGPQQRIVLKPAEQTLSDDGRFHYLGGRAPLRARLAKRAEKLALAAADVVPGLFGYVGVDLVLGRSKGYVIEINPRLTTSYIGVRSLAVSNLAAALLEVAEGIPVQLRWRKQGRAHWNTEGVTSVV